MVRARLVAAVAAAAAVLVLGSACTTAASGQPPAPPSTPQVPSGGIAPDTRFTPLTATTLTVPAPVAGTDGKTHLAYELVLTNPSGAEVRLDRVDVLDSGSQQVLLSLAGPQLAASSNLIGAPTGDQGTAEGAPATETTIPSSSTSVVWLDVPLTDPAPAGLDHRLAMSILSPAGPPTAVEGVVARIPTSTAAPVVLGSPLQGGEWYASDGCCADDTHHRRGLAPVNGQLLVPQRFAVDWFLLDDQHRAWTGDPAQLTSYLGYDKPAIAAADGVVVDALDGLPETTSAPHPPPIPPIAETVGNHVTLMVAPGVYVLYAHFRTGTVAVRTGQQVKRGDVVGHIGSSGNSTTPHLHFQVMTQPTFFPTDSTPYVFDCFQLTGQITQRIWDDVLGLQPTGVLPYVPAPDPGRRTDQMPLDRNVVRFTC